MAALASANCCRDSFTRPAALREFSELVRASELISELEAELSSSDAASCDEPWASDWLEAEPSPAAAATCSAPLFKPATIWRNVVVIRKTSHNTAAATIMLN